MIDLEQALKDPSCVFESPQHVAASKTLSTDDKIAILRRWEYDARELEVAEEENMGGDAPDVLDEVLQALRSLDAESESGDSAPTKQGGR